MEQHVGMENNKNFWTIKFLLIILAIFLLEGCQSLISNINSQSRISNSGNVSVPSAKTGITPLSTRSNSAIHLIKGGEICEDYLIKKITSEQNSENKLTRMKNFNPNDKNLLPELKKWLDSADFEKLNVFELKNNSKSATILGSRNVGSTGLASNFEYWFVLQDNHSVTFESLSKNPRLIFWDKDGLLNYYSIKYSGEFIDRKDFDNLTLDLFRHKINSEGKSLLMDEERNVKCE